MVSGDGFSFISEELAAAIKMTEVKHFRYVGDGFLSPGLSGILTVIHVY